LSGPVRDAWRAAWRGMGGWRWLWLALIVLCFCLLPVEIGR
jgi:hypothetical protein